MKIIKNIIKIIVVISPILIFLSIFYLPNLFSSFQPNQDQKVSLADDQLTHYSPGWSSVIEKFYSNMLSPILLFILLISACLFVIGLIFWVKYKFEKDTKNSLKSRKILLWSFFIIFFVAIDWLIIEMLTAEFCGNCGTHYISPAPNIPTI